MKALALICLLQTERIVIMEKFETLNGVAAPLNIVNIDTDMIIPKQFLKTIKRTGPRQIPVL